MRSLRHSGVTVRRILIGLIAAAVVAISAAGTPAAFAKSCPSNFVKATIGGEQKCLHAGEYCAVRYERQYQHHHFKCVQDDGYRLKSD